MYKLNIMIPTHDRYQMLKIQLDELNSEHIDGLIINVFDSSTVFNPQLLDNHLMLNSINWRFYDKKMSGSQKILKILMEPSAEYNMILNDRDFFTIETIRVLVDKLKSVEKFSLGRYRLLFDYKKKYVSEKRIINKYRILSELMYLGTHPTGWIFSFEVLKNNINILKFFYDTNYQYLYPHLQFMLRSSFQNDFSEFFYSKSNQIQTINSNNLIDTRSSFLENNHQIKMVDPMALSVDIASMISSLNNQHGYKINSKIVFDYILFGAIRSTLIRRELYKKDSNFLIHHNESSKIYSNKELLNFADQYIKLLNSNLVNLIDKSLTNIILLKYYLFLKLSVNFLTFARIPSNLRLFYYRLERKLFIYFLRLL